MMTNVDEHDYVSVEDNSLEKVKEYVYPGQQVLLAKENEMIQENSAAGIGRPSGSHESFWRIGSNVL